MIWPIQRLFSLAIRSTTYTILVRCFVRSIRTLPLNVMSIVTLPMARCATVSFLLPSLLQKWFRDLMLLLLCSCHIRWIVRYFPGIKCILQLIECYLCQMDPTFDFASNKFTNVHANKLLCQEIYLPIWQYPVGKLGILVGKATVSKTLWIGHEH